MPTPSSDETYSPFLAGTKPAPSSVRNGKLLASRHFLAGASASPSAVFLVGRGLYRCTGHSHLQRDSSRNVLMVVDLIDANYAARSRLQVGRSNKGQFHLEGLPGGPRESYRAKRVKQLPRLSISSAAIDDVAVLWIGLVLTFLSKDRSSFSFKFDDLAAVAFNNQPSVGKDHVLTVATASVFFPLIVFVMIRD